MNVTLTESSADNETLWIRVPVSRALLEDDETMAEWAAQKAAQLAKEAVLDWRKQNA
jgi:hypothetical protein